MPLTCPEDATAFAANCKVELNPGAWNFWLLQRTLSSAGSAPAQSELEILLGASAVQRLTGLRGPWGDNLGNQLDNPELKYITDHLAAYDMTGAVDTVRGQIDEDKLDAKLRELGKLTDTQVLERVQNRALLGDKCPLPLTSGPSTTILLVWYYNGTQTEAPWPVHTYGLWNNDCPIGTDWQLDSVYKPLTRKGKPEKPRPIFPDLPEVGPGAAILPLAVFALAGIGVTYAVVKAAK